VNGVKNEQVLDLIGRLGLKRLDIKVYIFLAKKGPRKGRELCNELKIAKQQLYPCLENLQRKGIVNATAEHPATFKALPFEVVLDLSIKSKIDEALNTKQHKTDLLSLWESMPSEEANRKANQ
jgi:sugar-specific transcriptional regulator TrmB